MMRTNDYGGFAALAALAVGVIGVLYAISFLVYSRVDSSPLWAGLTALFLMLGGLLTWPVLVGLYERLHGLSAAWALLGVLLGAAGALGSLVHGGYDLANVIHPPTGDPLAAANLPFQVDPRGLLTFGVAGLALAILVWLMRAAGGWPSGLTMLGGVLAALLIIIYLARLIILDAGNPLVLAIVALTGLIIYPAWFIWLGLTWRRRSAGG